MTDGRAVALFHLLPTYISNKVLLQGTSLSSLGLLSAPRHVLTFLTQGVDGGGVGGWGAGGLTRLSLLRE